MISAIWQKLEIGEIFTKQWRRKKNNEKSDNKVPWFLSSASGSVNQAEISIISNEIKSYTQLRKNYNTSVPESIKNEVGE